MSRTIASCFTCFFVLSFFFCFCTLIYIFNLPQQHTIHVVVSCIFTVWVVYFCRSAAFCSVLIFCNLQQSELTDHMNVSLDEWGRDTQWESLCWSEGEKNFGVLLIHLYCSSVLQRDFLSSNHLSVISQSLFFETGDLWLQRESAATSPQSVTDPNSMTPFLSSELIFPLPQFIPSSWADGLLLVKSQCVCAVKCHFFGIQECLSSHLRGRQSCFT